MAKTAKAGAAKRALIKPKADERCIGRDEKGRTQESDDVSRAIARDRKKKAKPTVESGQGDKGE